MNKLGGVGKRSFALLAIIVLGLVLGIRILAGGYVEPSRSGIREQLSIEEVALKSDYVVVGTVKNVSSRWDVNTRYIYTYVLFTVSQYIKGYQSQREIFLTTPGGSVGPIKQWTEDAPGFSAGEKAVVFLEEKPDGLHARDKLLIENDKVVGSTIFLEKENTTLAEVIARIERITRG